MKFKLLIIQCAQLVVASTPYQQNEYIDPNNAAAGNVLVLTKPLGILVAISAHQWLEQDKQWKTIRNVVTKEEVQTAYQQAMDSMAQLNIKASHIMHKYNAHGSTDVTEFGILGHAQVLASYQKEEVSFVIHVLPVIAKMAEVAKACGNKFQLLEGHSPEPSGGLLICLPRRMAKAYSKCIEEQEGHQVWVIGIVEKGDKTARCINKPTIIDVPAKN